MPSEKTTNLDAHTDPVDADLFMTVDVSDTTMSVAGSNKKMAGSVTRRFIQAGGRAINPQTTAYTLVVDDAGKIVTVDSPTGVDLTVPDDTTADLPIGCQVWVFQLGAGKVSFVPEGGIASYRSSAQGAWVILTKLAADTWATNGDLETV